MKLSTSEVLRLTAAVIAGFAGGQIQLTDSRVLASSDSVVRAQGFELVDKAGRLRGSWTSGDGNSAALRFVDSHGIAIADLGLQSNASPYLNMLSRDSKIRLTLRLEGQRSKPILGMSDEKWEGRMILGFVQPDSASPSYDDWGLVFREPNGGREVVSVGTVRDTVSGRDTGRIALLNGQGKYWIAPNR